MNAVHDIMPERRPGHRLPALGGGLVSQAGHPGRGPGDQIVRHGGRRGALVGVSQTMRTAPTYTSHMTGWTWTTWPVEGASTIRPPPR
jgi:hypothetical protein